jgi:hypothetical protein
VRRAVRPVPSDPPAVVPCRPAAVPPPATRHEKSGALRDCVDVLPSAGRRMRIESTTLCVNTGIHMYTVHCHFFFWAGGQPITLLALDESNLLIRGRGAI